MAFKSIVQKVLDWDARELGNRAGLRGGWPEAFRRPHVHRLTRHADGSRAIRQRFAGDLREDVGHREAQLVSERAGFKLERVGLKLRSHRVELG